jgi:hypothetical protein
MTDPEWTWRGKTVAQLITELQTFEDQGMEVRISVDDGKTSLPISLVAKSDGRIALLQNCQEFPVPMQHEQHDPE